MKNFNPKGRRAIRILLAAPLLMPLAAFAQVCDQPDFPDGTITSVQDRDRMLCQFGIAFPIMPPRIDDPNRPVNSAPANPANTEGNWTDPRRHVVLRTNFGLWHTYDSDSGELGGAMSGVGDYGPFSTPRYTDIKLLRMKNGSKVHDSEDWWLRRRPEIFKLVQQQLYGKPIDPAIPWSAR